MGLWKDKTRKHWCYSFEYQKQTYRKRGFATRREAASAREEKRKELKAAARATPTGMGFLDLANQYLDYSSRRFAEQTFKYKQLVFKSFLSFYGGDILVHEITPQHVHRYLDTRPSNNNYNAHRKDLSALFNFARRRLKLDIHNPCLDLDKMPHSPPEKVVPTEEEILRLIVAASPGDERDVLLCCLHTLGRIDEVLRLSWQDVNFEKRVVTLWTRKRRNGAYEADALPMNQDLYDVLRGRWTTRAQDKWVFFNEDSGTRFMHRPKRMAALCKRAGISPIGTGRRKLTPQQIRAFVKKNKRDPGPEEMFVEVPIYYGFHCLRHFMASYLADQEKVGTKAVSGLLRHKNLRTTEIYLHSIDESQRSAMDGLEGKFAPKKTYPPPRAATKNDEGAMS